MTDEQILKKAIEIAYLNRFKGDFGGGNPQPKCCEAHSSESEGSCSFTTIFSHDFARAFWGTGKSLKVS